VRIDCAHDSKQTVKYDNNGREIPRPDDCLKTAKVVELPHVLGLDADNDVEREERGERALSTVLDEARRFLRRFVVLTDHQAVAATLWVFHTYAVDAAETTPYLSVSSAEKRSGKTRLLEVFELLVRNPLPSVNISDAALFRAIHTKTPTVMFDEIDAIFGAKARDREDLRGMLNAGYRRGAVTHRMGGANMSSLEEFNVFCAKVFAGIGELPDTIRDRAIRIRLQRRTRDEQIERFRRRDVEEVAAPIREALANIALNYIDVLAKARPKLPDALDDRAQDVWEPLLAIADLAGADWPKLAREAAAALSTGVEREDDSLGARLLLDLHLIFTEKEPKRYRTSDLIAELSRIEESPWGDYNGKPISSQKLSNLLKPYGIRTMSVWADGETVKGYKADQFADAWLRVHGVRWVREVRTGTSIEAGTNPPNPPNPDYGEAA
jgi:hypothetical protein